MSDNLDSAVVRVVDIRRFERSVRLRIPFQFGVTTLRTTTQAVVEVDIELPDGSIATGQSAESLLPKWFDKSPELSDADNMEQLRRALDVAERLYRSHRPASPFAFYADAYEAQIAAMDASPLVACYGPALLDRAIADALGRALDLPFSELVRRNVLGIRTDALTPDLACFDLGPFLDGLRFAPTIAVRHTVGLSDPLTESNLSDVPLDDGLPETLEQVVAAYGGRHYKVKVFGRAEVDLDRLTQVAAVLDRIAEPYLVSLDGNENFATLESFLELWAKMHEVPALERFLGSIAFVEQPIKRAVALDVPIRSDALAVPMIIDESDGELGSFPRAVALGYRGVSSKNCKGFYKSILNAARVSSLNRHAGEPRYFLSGEDLNTWAGTCVQQDLALVSLLGITHVERNGHHFIDGMGFAPQTEQAKFAAHHPGLYRTTPGRPVRLAIREGRLDISSLDGPGFGVNTMIDTGALAAMRPPPGG